MLQTVEALPEGHFLQPTIAQKMTVDKAFDGQPAKVVTLVNSHGVNVAFMDIGATWLSCVLPVKGGAREVLLGVSNMADFNQQPSYLGATVGRYANRIAAGKFTIEGQDYSVDVNQAGNCLHGGKEGFNKRRWEIVEQSSRAVLFCLQSPDGDQGFPGNVTVSVRYELSDDNQVSITYLANTDQPTVVNLTNHAYFNLLGAESEHDCLSHILSINSDEYLPTNDVGIPLQGLAPVANTGFDFNSPKVIAQDLMCDEQQQAAQGYDHSFRLNKRCKQGECAATVHSSDGLVSMKVFTTKPALQLYTGNWLGGTPNRVGSQYKAYSGLALETQFLPDSPNHPEWDQESCILHPDQDYAYTTCYQFDVLGDSLN